MQLTEQHILGRSDSRFEAVDVASFAAKNLYNAANYHIRQSFIGGDGYLTYPEMHALMKGHEAYTVLPRKVSQQVLRMLDQNWRSFFAATKAYRENPSKFRKRPGLPRYLDKKRGRFALVYTIQALSKPALKQGLIVPSGLAIVVQTKQTRIAQVRIVPKCDFYVVEVVYERAATPAAVDPSLVAGVDIGLNRSSTSTSSTTSAKRTCKPSSARLARRP